MLEDWIGGTSTCWMPRRASICALILAAAAAAAAAGSTGVMGFESIEGLRTDFDKGLLLRRDSEFLETGERDLRSNLEVFRGSGSVWSKRERFLGALSSHIMTQAVDEHRVVRVVR